MANKSVLVLSFVFHAFSMSLAMNWMLSRPQQCPGKVPRSQALIWTSEAISTVECVKKCEENHLCLAVYYNGECRMYSSVADKECTGFVVETDSVNSKYFEIQQKCKGSKCSCTKTYRGRSCNINIIAIGAVSYLPMDEIKDDKLVGYGLIPTFGVKPAFEPGKDGNAIRMQYPTYLDYGDQRHRCLGNFDKCSSGWTAAMWLYNFDGNRHGGYFLSTGGQTASIGMALVYYNDANGDYIKCLLKTSRMKWSKSVKMSVQIWYHIAITWSTDNGLAIYLNGHLVIEQKTGKDETTTVDISRNFTIGVPNNILSLSDFSQANYYPNGYIDDLMVWEKSLSAELIADLYNTPNYKHD
ncbi:uncharacterized protein LOC135484853 [Lineus longissimus]|uniref:uncharacterized protein LOC135484853 n=1 Tax=Lineus longissimus TaxID=88925 RepID=UPI00315C5527